MQITNPINQYKLTQNTWKKESITDQVTTAANAKTNETAATITNDRNIDTILTTAQTDEKQEQASTDSTEKESLLEQQKDYLKDQIDFQEQLESSKAEAKAAATEYENLSKCFTIARRIMNGHKVPSKDVKFLMEKQPKLYKQAILCRQENAHPKKYKRLSKDEEAEETSSLTDDMKAKLLDLENKTDESGSVEGGETQEAETAPTSIDILI